MVTRHGRWPVATLPVLAASLCALSLTSAQAAPGPMRQGLADAWWQMVRDRAEVDTERLDAASNLADSLLKGGKYVEAEETHRKVHAVRKRVLGAEHRDTLTAAGNLATSLAQHGKHAEAEDPG